MADYNIIATQVISDKAITTCLILTENFIALAVDDAKIRVFERDGTPRWTLEGHTGGIWTLASWENTLVSGSTDCDVRVWDVVSGTCTMVLKGHTLTARGLEFADATTVISASRDTTLRIWDLHTGECLRVLEGHEKTIRAIAVHGDIVVSASYDGQARVWNWRSGECLHVLKEHTKQVYSVVFDGDLIATGSLDNTVRVWNPNLGSCVAVLQGHNSLVGLLILRDKTLVSAGADGRVCKWLLDEEDPLSFAIEAHTWAVTCLAYDGKSLVSGGEDGIKMWDVETGKFVRELSSGFRAAWTVAIDEEIIVTSVLRGNECIMEILPRRLGEDVAS